MRVMVILFDFYLSVVSLIFILQITFSKSHFFGIELLEILWSL